MSSQSTTIRRGTGWWVSKNQNVPIDQRLLVASAAQTGVDEGLQALATKVSGLKLRLPDEGDSRFSVAAYGDFSSIVLIMKESIAMGIRSPDQVAYILSTAWLESRMGNWMTESAWLSKSSAERRMEKTSMVPMGEELQRLEVYGNTNPRWCQIYGTRLRPVNPER